MRGADQRIDLNLIVELITLARWTGSSNHCWVQRTFANVTCSLCEVLVSIGNRSEGVIQTLANSIGVSLSVLITSSNTFDIIVGELNKSDCAFAVVQISCRSDGAHHVGKRITAGLLALGELELSFVLFSEQVVNWLTSIAGADWLTNWVHWNSCRRNKVGTTLNTDQRIWGNLWVSSVAFAYSWKSKCFWESRANESVTNEWVVLNSVEELVTFADWWSGYVGWVKRTSASSKYISYQELFFLALANSVLIWGLFNCVNTIKVANHWMRRFLYKSLNADALVQNRPIAQN